MVCHENDGRIIVWNSVFPDHFDITEENAHQHLDKEHHNIITIAATAHDVWSIQDFCCSGTCNRPFPTSHPTHLSPTPPSMADSQLCTQATQEFESEDPLSLGGTQPEKTHWGILTPLTATSSTQVVLDKDLVTFGRHQGCDVSFDDKRVSNVHCKIRREMKDGYHSVFLEDHRYIDDLVDSVHPCSPHHPFPHTDRLSILPNTLHPPHIPSYTLPLSPIPFNFPFSPLTLLSITPRTDT
eukprot:TRINITY_DN6777_c0_g1_i1.p1 TRINITY_DN6777_c0_g1~~TRINITY_DN6777_c0_g1_i1.p1  ORF type:complete len:240 (+),score=23.38 TRINITY_DN6777_c0_g1_i1:61-780(+)